MRQNFLIFSLLFNLGKDVVHETVFGVPHSGVELLPGNGVFDLEYVDDVASMRNSAGAIQSICTMTVIIEIVI